jgi:hypothetical protein
MQPLILFILGYFHKKAEIVSRPIAQIPDFKHRDRLAQRWTGTTPIHLCAN